MARRRALVPTITYPEDLPVVDRREDIAAAIRDHQVVIVAGETGSGKTTQIPKICLELGRGVEGTIGHTQPRRIAARSVAERIAEELDTELGGAVGYQVRFTDHSTSDTLVKVMTDGILLAELQRDRDLRRYDTIIIDEAHERSLNIDFLLGYLKQLLPRRPDLKVIITSATIDPERFAEHFASNGTPAPIIEVSGRTYPVEVRYRPLGGGDPEDDRDQVTGICDAVEELLDRGRRRHPGLPLRGARDPRRRRALDGLSLPRTEILPLYARLSAAEQHRVFGRHTGRRIVLATNVAETSLTVPGIRYVVDAGTARISRYSQRTKVQRLPIEPISQASASQRAGRCGRVADGICIRLYSEEDFESRPEFTDPEILRTNLASVILQMTSLGLGDIARFPFVEPPDSPPDHRRRQAAGGAAGDRRRRRPTRASGSPPPAARSPRCRSTRAWRGWCSRPRRNGCAARGAGHRRGPVHPGPARAADGEAAAGRRAAPPVRRRALRLRRAAQPVALPQGAAARAVRQRVPPHVQGRVPALPADPRVAGPAQPAQGGVQDPWPAAELGRGRRRPRSTSRCSPDCSRTSGCATSRSASTSARATPGSASRPARRCSGSSRSG